MNETRRVASVCLLLYVLYFALLTALRLAANAQGVILMEETSSSFVDPTYLSLRLQHDTIATNIGAYWIFWLASWLPSPPDLFYGRAAKVVFSSSIPVWIFLLLHVRLKVAGIAAFAASLGIVLLPGILSFGWFGAELLLDLPFALAALYFALGESPSEIATSGLLFGQALLTYGSSILFMPALLYLWFRHFRSGAQRAVLLAMGLLLLPFVASVAWWTNIQTLLLGGGAQDHLPVRFIVRVLLTDLFSRDLSYYFLTNGRPAMGSLWTAVLAVAATLISLRTWKQNWIWLSIIAAGIVVSFTGGGPPGIRRLAPVVVALGILSTLFLVELSENYKPAAAWIVAAGILVHLSFHAYGYWADLTNRRIELKPAFRFENLPGLDMAQSFAAMRDGLAPVPSDFQKYDPDRTLAILYMTSRSRPVVAKEQLLRSAALEDNTIAPSETRFERFLQ